MISALLALLVVSGAQATPPPIDIPYRFTVGGAPVVDGTLWLYNEESWGPDRAELGTIKGGVGAVHLDAAMVNGIDSHGDKNVYWVALHVEGVAWFKTPSFRDPFRDVAHAIGELGRTSQASGGETIVDVKPPVKHTIQLLDASGRPLTGVKLRVHTYLGEKGRCRVRNQFEDWGPNDGAKDDDHDLVSDNDGLVQFMMPFTPMVLHVEHYTRERNGAGRDVLTPTSDIDLPAALNQTVRLQMMRAPARPFTLRLLTPDNAPVAGMWLVKNEGGCRASDGPEGTTDANGEVQVTFSPEHAHALWFQRATDEYYGQAPAGQLRQLTEPEIARLFSTGALTTTWQPPK